MKYVEPVKSIILTFLVLLSITLTFVIWSYEPDYQFLEEPDIQQVSISEEKEFRDVIRPYKALYNIEDTLYGTLSVKTLDETINLLAALDIGNIRVANENATAQSINQLMNNDDQIVLFFNTTIPIETLNNVLKFNEASVGNMQFDRIILRTRAEYNTAELRFVNTKTNVVYRAAATINNEKQVLDTMRSLVDHSFEYNELSIDNQLSLYLPKHKSTVVKYTYFIDEISKELLTEILFTDSSVVPKSIEGNLEKYIGGMSLMTFDTSSKTMTYVNAQAENSSVEPAATLINNTFNFVNDHSGFNADFRLSTVDPAQKLVDYQLFFHGHPVFSSTTTTRISTTWGDNSVFRYRRPYYELETDITTEKMKKDLMSGKELKKQLQRQFDNQALIDEVIIGYSLVQDTKTGLFILDPDWFVISGSTWTRIAPPNEGGAKSGLE